MSRLSSKQDGRPSMQFYPDDWLSEPGLRAAPPEVRGVWIDLLCFAWKSPERGVLLLPDGCVPDAEAMRRLCGIDTETWQRVEAELLRYGIASKRPTDGALYCRRMLRERLAEGRKSESGRRAAHARWMRKHGSSSSSSSSSSTPISTICPKHNSATSDGRGRPGKAKAAKDSPDKRVSRTDQQAVLEAYRTAYRETQSADYEFSRQDAIQAAALLVRLGYKTNPADAVKRALASLELAVAIDRQARQLSCPDRFDLFPLTCAEFCSARRFSRLTQAQLETVARRVAGIREAVENKRKMAGEPAVTSAAPPPLLAERVARFLADYRKLHGTRLDKLEFATWLGEQKLTQQQRDYLAHQFAIAEGWTERDLS